MRGPFFACASTAIARGTVTRTPRRLGFSANKGRGDARFRAGDTITPVAHVRERFTPKFAGTHADSIFARPCACARVDRRPVGACGVRSRTTSCSLVGSRARGHAVAGRPRSAHDRGPTARATTTRASGQSGLGKSTFVRTLLADSSFIPRDEDKPRDLTSVKTTEIKVFGTGTVAGGSFRARGRRSETHPPRRHRLRLARLGARR